MTGISHAIAVVAIALAGLGGFTLLGGSMERAIAGASSPGAAREVSVPALSQQASALEDLARAGVELYRDIPLKLELDDIRWEQTLNPQVQYLGESGISLEGFGPRLGVTDGEARLLYGLYQELFQLRDEGLFKVGEYRTGKENATQYALRALAAVPYKAFPEVSSITEELNGARSFLRQDGLPVPEQFFNRIQTAAQIYRGGIDEATRATVFDGVRRGSMRLTADLLGRYKNPPVTALEFALRYDGNPRAMLDLVPEAGRAYIEAEIVPFLQSDGALRRESEGAILGAIVTGDGNALTARLEAGVAGSETLPPETAEALRFATTMFERSERGDVVVPFTPEEANSLIRYPNMEPDALAARENGGGPLAALVQIVAETDFKRRPGRSSAHENQVIEGLLRAIARGDRVAFEQHEIVLSNVVQQIPDRLVANMREVLDYFERAVELPEGPTP